MCTTLRDQRDQTFEKLPSCLLCLVRTIAKTSRRTTRQPDSYLVDVGDCEFIVFPRDVEILRLADGGVQIQRDGSMIARFNRDQYFRVMPVYNFDIET